MENFRDIQGLQDKRSGAEKANRSPLYVDVLKEDVCMPFMRQIQGHCKDRKKQEEQARATILNGSVAILLKNIAVDLYTCLV